MPLPNRKKISELKDLGYSDKDLIEMDQDGEICMYPQDDPTQITQQDRDTAVSYGGELMMIAYTD